jgi:O-antigen ligase
MRSRLASVLTVVMEGIVAFLVLFAAWPFGSVHAYFQWMLLTGVGVLLACWAARAILVGQSLWVACPITLGLATLCLLAIVQVVPLDADWVRRLSPETARLQEFLMPTPEELTSAAAVDDGVRTLSLDAGATRTCVLQLVAVLALFAVVRNNLRDPGAFYRLAWLAAINGVLLALVGMGQLASSPPNVVFWSFPTRGQVFGPFICRNHFAYYANLCLGLAAGLLLGTRYFLAPPHNGRGTHRAWRGLFRDPRVLWLGTCLAILLAGLLACLSRGGVLGLAIGGCVALGLMRTRAETPRWIMGIGVMALAGLLVLWLGFDRVSRRWEAVWHDNVVAEARTTVWLRTLPLIERFPIWGSGLGTFGVVEPQLRQPGDPWNILHDHAHNDFLELWIEGGTAQLLVALILVGLVIRQGVLAFRRHADSAMGRLALGALAGFIAVVVQSFVDFGLHIPAVAVLAAVMAAMLANLAEVPAQIPEAAPQPAPLPTGLSLGALAQCAALVAVGLFLVSAGMRAEQAERYRLAARDVVGPRQLAYLRSAIALAPDRAELHVQLADALRQAHHAPPSDPLLREARLHIARARQLSPLSLDAQNWALYLETLGARNDQQTRALDRLLHLAPCDPGPWYEAGRRALARGERSEACRCWRNALLGGEGYLKRIVQAVPDALSTQELCEQVLPANPAMIVTALDALAPIGLARQEEQRFLNTARDLLAGRADELPAEDRLLLARVHARMNDESAARKAYQAALASKPWSAGVRLEFSEFLHRMGHYSEARQELQVLLAQEPTNQAAKRLQQEVLRRVAEHE